MLNHPENDHSTPFNPENEKLDPSLDDNDVTLLDALQTNSDVTEKLSEKDIRKIIAEAHHDLLYTSGNHAYVKIWEELHRVKWVFQFTVQKKISM